MLMESLQLLKIMPISNRTAWFKFSCFFQVNIYVLRSLCLWSLWIYRSSPHYVCTGSRSWQQGGGARWVRWHGTSITARGCCEVLSRRLARTSWWKKGCEPGRWGTGSQGAGCSSPQCITPLYVKSLVGTRNVKMSLMGWRTVGSILFPLLCVGSLWQVWDINFLCIYYS